MPVRFEESVGLKHQQLSPLPSFKVWRARGKVWPGGARTAACLIGEVGDPARFRSAGALASYVGAVPRLKQSGKRAISKTRTLPLGDAHLRQRLWMPTLVAVRINPWLRAQYQRLCSARKPPKLALVACMRKLLAAVYSVVRSRRPFVPNLTSEHICGVC
jgi:transposase